MKQSMFAWPSALSALEKYLNNNNNSMNLSMNLTNYKLDNNTDCLSSLCFD